MKKQVVVALFATVFLFSLALVSAASVEEFFSDVTSFIESVLRGLKPLATLLFGSENLGVAASSDSFTIANIMIFLIVFVIVYLIIDSIPFFSEHRWAVNLLSVVVSILSVRFLSDGMINTIIFPYKALGIALAAGLPFVLYFFFVEFKISSSWGRKFAWIFLAVIYIFLFFVRYGSSDSGAQELSSFVWIYFVAGLLALLLAWFDGTLAGIRAKATLSRIGKSSHEAAITDYRRKIADLPNLVREGVYTHAEADKKKKEYIKEIEYHMRDD